MSDELREALPCPFCGCTDLRCEGGWVTCNACEADGPFIGKRSDIKALAAWNRRAAAPAEAQQPVAWLIATVEGYSPFPSLSEGDAEYYAKHGWTVTPLVPQRATPQPSIARDSLAGHLLERLPELRDRWNDGDTRVASDLFDIIDALVPQPEGA